MKIFLQFTRSHTILRPGSELFAVKPLKPQKDLPGQDLRDLYVMRGLFLAVIIAY